jgi:myo-inositol 2-dehydrogenase/D-chiro-inositol 1-dehydrogenase
MDALAKELSAKSGAAINQHASVESLVSDSNVDAVIICSPDGLHPEHLTLAINAGKHTLCEKPLAPKSADAKKVADLANASGLNITLGFMRRFDPSYIELKKEIQSGKYGKVLHLRCISRNVSSPTATTPMLLTNVAVHEVDIARWLLGEEFVSMTTVAMKRTKFANDQLQDPLTVLAHTESGVLMTVDIAANSTYGYEVRMEALMENGSLEIDNLGGVSISYDFNLPPRTHGKLYENWMGRFEQAYINELTAWVGSIKSGVRHPDLATANDGLASSIACELGVASLK